MTLKLAPKKSNETEVYGNLGNKRKKQEVEICEKSFSESNYST